MPVGSLEIKFWW